MAYFPAFIKFDNKKILIVGGGYIAYEKLEHLLDFTNNITLIAKDYNENTEKLINENSLEYFKKLYVEGDIKGFDIIIAAVDDFNLQESIYKESRNYNCLCNCVDLQKYCDFIFPSYVKKGDLTIAVSTSGSSPAMAKHLRIWLNKMIPDSIVDFLKQMREYRKNIPKGKERMQFLDKKAKNYISTWKEEK
ncbi:bifunctional precorrin-2 dehydrogenase/sirohydrochlorin ferrochelatase [Arcobacter sp. LA11]|uniref:precorrin-2 dehydrogenase/sirohydrochlorin ferrochelatase family protein n=1 Tax=Arcobacter sp. LA11 TaxID=1898176 RepID=UPI0009354F16|nr:bifunctional precorrin-2 dehydrogenase/sirohydrochlorin ferrochelatase [Arcobacter sp. LA11]